MAVVGGELLEPLPPRASPGRSAPPKVTAGPKSPYEDLSRRCSICFLTWSAD